MAPQDHQFTGQLSLVAAAGTVVIAMVGKGFTDFEDGIGGGHGGEALRLPMVAHQPIRVSPATWSK
jgi:hypothetical protein